MSPPRVVLAVLAVSATTVAGLAAAEPAPGARIALGAYIPNATHQPRAIDRYAGRVGRRPLIVASYKQWDTRAFVRDELRAVWRRGALPMITWEPWSYHGRRFPLGAIARGRYDGYVRRAARAAARWNRPILLRFAHEMNGNWYPWGRGVDGNTPRRFKNAWRHVVRIFRRNGARKVRWVWTPYVNQSGRLPFRRLYPGSRYVDWVGLDGFNWGASRGAWQPFGKIFGDSYRQLRRISNAPILIGETGSAEAGGSKRSWVSRALRRQLPRFRKVRAVVWFSAHGVGADFRVDSSRSALRAFRRGAAKGTYDSSRRRLLSFGRGR